MTAAEKDKPPAVKPAGRRLEWPTLWHKAQLPFPWGGATRLRKGPQKPPQPAPAKQP
jgi:hypothetical protein